MQEPIITSLMDLDFYKFPMGQVIFKEFRDVPVTFALNVRTKGVRLGEYVRSEDLRRELDHVRTLRFTKSELHYLRGTNEYQDRMFTEDYLDFLAALQLPDYLLERNGDGYRLEFSGKWSRATYWETLSMSIINELYFRMLMSRLTDFQRDVVNSEGKRRLHGKIEKLKANPDVAFCDFGTRRRFSRQWQEYVVRTLASELPASQFLGTSNTKLAMDLALLPMGTSAHEMPMGLSGLMRGSDEELRRSQTALLTIWEKHYGLGLSVALPDTYGTDSFLADITPEQARNWKGFRGDSGDPFHEGEKYIRFYEKHEVDPRGKLYLASDGLDVDLMIALTNHFKGRITVKHGWGTNLTNDLGFPEGQTPAGSPDLKPFSMVVKLVRSNDFGTVKLSNNLAKATGSPEDIERFKRVFNYTETLNQSCTY